MSVGFPRAFQVKQALEKRGIKVDYRQGREGEADVIRIGPHFYSLESEIDLSGWAMEPEIDAARIAERYLELAAPVTFPGSP